MNPSPSDLNQPKDTSTEDWFNAQLESDKPPQQEPSSSKKKLIFLSLLVVGVVGALVSVVVVAIMISNESSRLACLTPASYEELSGVKLEDTSTFSPKSNVYTTDLAFENQSTSYATGMEESSASKIEDFGVFYKNYSETNSVSIEISGGYTENDSKESAKERLDLVKSKLIESGVSEEAISTEGPYRIIGEEIPEDSTELTRANVYISVASDAECRE